MLGPWRDTDRCDVQSVFHERPATVVLAPNVSPNVMEPCRLARRSSSGSQDVSRIGIFFVAVADIDDLVALAELF